MPKLRKIDIDKLECPNDKNLVYLWDSTMPGFGVRCTSAGIKSFIVRYRLAGRQRIKTLGRVSVIDLTDARDKARSALNDASGGDDPFISSAKEVQTVRDLKNAFQEGRKDDLKPKTLDSYESLWVHIDKALGTTPIISLGEDSVRKLKSHLGNKHTTFNRCISLVLTALKWQGVSIDNHAFRRVKNIKRKAVSVFYPNKRMRISIRHWGNTKPINAPDGDTPIFLFFCF